MERVSVVLILLSSFAFLFLTSITTGYIQMSKHALAISDKQSAREHSPTELIPTSMFSCGRREIPSHTGASTTPITPTFPSLTTPSLSVSLRHPVPTWKVLEYCEIIISHNWKGIYVTTKAKDIAEDKGTSEDILRSPAKRLPVSLDRGHQASIPLEGSLRYWKKQAQSRESPPWNSA